MRISDWSSDVCSSDLIVEVNSAARAEQAIAQMSEWLGDCVSTPMTEIRTLAQFMADDAARAPQEEPLDIPPNEMERIVHQMLTREYTKTLDERSEEHTSELQSLMRISYAVFCLKKQTHNTITKNTLH